MKWNATYQKKTEAVLGTFNGINNGQSIGAGKVDIGPASSQLLTGLSALVTVLAETSGLTLTPRWQVSNDGSTWVDFVHGSQNAAGVALATGTAGADSPVSKVYAAPESIEGWRFARIAIGVGGTNGTSSDTYSVSYVARDAKHYDPAKPR